MELATENTEHTERDPFLERKGIDSFLCELSALGGKR